MEQYLYAMNSKKSRFQVLMSLVKNVAGQGPHGDEASLESWERDAEKWEQMELRFERQPMPQGRETGLAGASF